MPHSTSYQRTWVERTFLTVFVLVWSLMASLFTYIFFVRPIALVIDARGWATVPCKIVYSKVVTFAGEGAGYGVEVLYDYAFEGKQYQSSHWEVPVYNRLSYKSKENQNGSSRLELPASYSSFNSRKSAQKAIDLLESKSQAVCFINPNNPSEAMLHRGLPSILWWGLIPLVFLLIPAVAICSLVAWVWGLLTGRRKDADLSRVDDVAIKRQVLHALVGICLAMFGIISVLFAIAWWDVQNAASLPKVVVQRLLSERVVDFRSSPQNWWRVSLNGERLSAKVTRPGGRNESVYRNRSMGKTAESLSQILS